MYLFTLFLCLNVCKMTSLTAHRINYSIHTPTELCKVTTFEDWGNGRNGQGVILLLILCGNHLCVTCDQITVHLES